MRISYHYLADGAWRLRCDECGSDFNFRNPFTRNNVCTPCGTEIHPRTFLGSLFPGTYPDIGCYTIYEPGLSHTLEYHENLYVPSFDWHHLSQLVQEGRGFMSVFVTTPAGRWGRWTG